MDTITEKPFDMEQFKQDLQELAQAYTTATETGDKQGCEDTFEALLHFGSEAFKTPDKEAQAAIEAAVKELKNVPSPHHLFIYMMGYGVQTSVETLLRNDAERIHNDRFDADALTANIIAYTVRLEASRVYSENAQWEAVLPGLTQAVQTEFDSIVEKIASLPNRFQIIKALELTQEHLGKLQKPLTTGPRALQEAGLRSYLKIYKAVRRKMLEDRRILGKF
jgi:hypothetical protein